jgi:hypothetical protein
LCFITEHPIQEVQKSWKENGIEVRFPSFALGCKDAC